MSAHTVVGTPYETAQKLDEFWATLSLEHRAALHVAFNLCQKSYPVQAAETLRNAGSGRTSISSVRGDFFHFMERNIDKCSTGEQMMEAILEFGKLTQEEQEAQKS